jgi:hypothetical protein
VVIQLRKPFEGVSFVLQFGVERGKVVGRLDVIREFVFNLRNGDLLKLFQTADMQF